MTRLWRVAVAGAVMLLVAAGCTTPATLTSDDGRVQVVVTTGILRDLVANVGGDRVSVAALVPDGADPHSYEPTLRAVRNVVYADVAFSNYLLLEQHAIVKALDANLPAGVPNISLAEASVRYAAEIIPLVENVALDTIWLGMRVQGSGADLGATRASDVLLRAVDVEGPGDWAMPWPQIAVLVLVAAAVVVRHRRGKRQRRDLDAKLAAARAEGRREALAGSNGKGDGHDADGAPGDGAPGDGAPGDGESADDATGDGVPGDGASGDDATPTRVSPEEAP